MTIFEIRDSDFQSDHFQNKEVQRAGRLRPPLGSYLYRPIDQNNKNNNQKTKMFFKSTQNFFRESLGTPLDEKSVSGRIYTYPTTFVANQFFSYFFGFSFLSKLDHYCPIS